MKKQNGITLLELLMVVGIAAVIAVASLVFFRTSSSQSEIKIEIDKLATVTTAIRNTVGQQPTYAGLDNSYVRSLPSVPETFLQGPSPTLSTRWATNGVTVQPINLQGNLDAFYTEYVRVPDKDCVDFTNKLSFKQFRQIFVNGTLVTNVSELTTECSGTFNTIRFVH